MAAEVKKTIIVLWDYTEASAIALEHAYQLAHVTGDTIMLVHCVPAKRAFSRAARDKQHDALESTRSKLTEQVEQLTKQYAALGAELALMLKKDNYIKHDVQSVTLLPLVVTYRNLSKAFFELFKSMEINLVVTPNFYQVNEKKSLNMATVLSKVPSGRLDTVPFIIVKNKPIHRYYTDLVVPMDNSWAFKESLRWIAYLSSYYHCNVNLIKPALNEGFNKRGMANNTYFTKKILDAHNVVYGIKTADRGQDFAHSVEHFSRLIDADMIIIMTDRAKKIFPKDIIKFDIPVMMINPLSKKIGGFN